MVLKRKKRKKNKKSQHFVPRFYLKYFSSTKDGKNICLFNIKKEIFIPSASIKHQACSPYFYGKDKVVENNLSKIEGVIANLISEILYLKELPIKYSEKHLLLLIFIISMHSRTKYSAEEINENIDKTFKIIFKDHPEVKDELQNFKIGIEYPATFYLGTALKIVPVALDLEFKLLSNKTNIPFITSDNPVIKYNQFLEYKKVYGGITGLAVKGIQILLPLNPYFYIIFYDQGVYKIGNKKQRVVEINKIRDINSLNLLQFINANENLYFNKDINQIYLDSLSKKGIKFRRDKKVNVNEYISNNKFDSQKSSLIVSYAEDIKINLNLSFIKLLKKAKRYKLDNKAVHMRNERVSKICDLITEKYKTLPRKNSNQHN